jgi:hypothetical protein
MTANHRGGDGNDDREARAVYHEILADAQALFLLLFGGGPPAPADLILEAVEALIADVEHCRALPAPARPRRSSNALPTSSPSKPPSLRPVPVSRP